MRLPSHVLTKLYLAGAVGTAGTIALLAPAPAPEPEPETCSSRVIIDEDPTPLSEVVRAPHVPSFAVAPLPQARPRPQPQPTRPEPQPVAKQPEKRMVWARVCGHAKLVADGANLMKCGRG